MPLSPEEITALEAEVKAGNLENGVIKTLSNFGLKIRTETQENEFLTNYENSKVKEKVEAEIGAKIREIHDRYDLDIFALTGLEKKAGQKTYDYLKEAVPAKIAEIKGKPGQSTDEDKRRIQELETLLASEKESFQTALSKKDQDLTNKEISFDIKASLADIKPQLRKIDEKIMADVTKSRLADFRDTYTPKKLEDGTVVYVDKDGKEARNPDTYKYKTTSELMTEFFKDLFEEVKPGKKGAGTEGDGAQAASAPPPSVKTKMQLTEWLKAKGLLSSSKEYNDIFEKYGKELPIGF